MLTLEAGKKNLAIKHIMSPGLFKRDNWKKMENAQVREAYFKSHQSYLEQFPWNKDETVSLSLLSRKQKGGFEKNLFFVSRFQFQSWFKEP